MSRSMNHAWKFLSHLDSSSLKALFLKIVSEGPSTGDVMFCNLWLSWQQTNVFCWNFDWKPQSNLPPLLAQCASFSMGKGIFASETLGFRRPSSRRREDRSFVPLPSSPFSLVSPIAASVRRARARPFVRPSIRCFLFHVLEKRGCFRLSLRRHAAARDAAKGGAAADGGGIC